MLSATEMILLRRKRALLARSARERAACVEAADAVAGRLRPLDRLYAGWRAVPRALKFAAVPLAVLARKKFFPKTKKNLSKYVRWIPLAWKLARL